MDPVDVGLVGAGPWAQLVHAPMLAANPHTRLAGIWARRPEAAAELAGRVGSSPVDRYEDLLDTCEAVAFAVPPGVQAEMATTAARRGKALLLEKPIAADLDGARRLADAVGEAGVASQIVLTWRYAAAVRDFLDASSRFDAVAGRGRFVSGALLGGMFATPWRLDRGPLLDLGPHVVDLLDAALGRVVGVRAHGDLHGWVGLLLEHESGRVSEASLSGSVAVEPQLADVELYGRDGQLRIDCATAVGPDAFGVVTSELAGLVREGGSHPLDVQRGLHLQQVISEAEQALTSG